VDAPLAASPNLVDQWRSGSSAESQQTKFAKNLTIRVIRIWAANCVRSSLPWPYAPRSITSWGQVGRLHGANSTPPASRSSSICPSPWAMCRTCPPRNSPASRASAISATRSWEGGLPRRPNPNQKCSKKIVIAYGEAEVPSPLNGLAHTIGRGGPRRQWSC